MENAVVGKIYFVRFEDCCVSGEFTSKFLGEDDGWWVFENGLKLEGYAIRFEEVVE